MKRYHCGRAASIRAIVIAVVLSSLPLGVRAQDRARDQALDLFEQAEDRYRESDLAGAIELLVRARALHREPVLLYNLARAYEGLGRFEEALEAYRQYLVEEPEAPDRGAIERRIASLTTELAERRELAERADEERRADTGEPPIGAPPAEEDQGPGALPWVVGALGVAVAGAGVTVGILADGKRSDAESDPVHATSRQSFRDAQSLATVANVLIVGGAVVTGAAALWLVLASGDANDEAVVAVGPGSISLLGAF